MTTSEDLHKHLRILRRREPRIAEAITFAGMPEPRRFEPGFATLIRIIAGQQVSISAAASIWAKLESAAKGKVTPKALLSLGESGLRGSGFSGQKARYALGLAEAAAARDLNLKALEKADEHTVRQTLTAFKGVGPWTADIYMMFGMGRPDVWPVGDLGLQVAVQRLWKMRARPKPTRLERMGEDWRPYRTSASILLWHFLHACKDKD